MAKITLKKKPSARSIQKMADELTYANMAAKVKRAEMDNQLKANIRLEATTLLAKIVRLIAEYDKSIITAEAEDTYERSMR